jgi:hypothetical protein
MSDQPTPGESLLPQIRDFAIDTWQREKHSKGKPPLTRIERNVLSNVIEYMPQVCPQSIPCLELLEGSKHPACALSNPTGRDACLRSSSLMLYLGVARLLTVMFRKLQEACSRTTCQVPRQPPVVSFHSLLTACSARSPS